MPSNPTERQPVYSFGRGGVGNMYSVLGPFDPAVRQPGPDDYSSPRGRELVDQRDELITTGRGGAGNTRPPSKDGRAAVEATIRIESRYTRERESRKGEQIYSTGRGGAGNMLCSFSFTDGYPALDPSKFEEDNKENAEHGEAAQSPPGQAVTHLADEITCA